MAFFQRRCVTPPQRLPRDDGEVEKDIIETTVAALNMVKGSRP